MSRLSNKKIYVYQISKYQTFSERIKNSSWSLNGKNADEKNSATYFPF